MTIKEKLKNRNTKRGDTMLLWVVLVVIVVMAFQGHVNILNQTSTVNMFQQQMDVAGLNALNKTIDINRLQADEELFGERNPESIGQSHRQQSGQMNQDEFIATYNKEVDTAFREELYSNIPTNKQIAKVEVLSTYVDFIQTDDGVLGTEHILLDAVVRITMNTFGVYNPHNEDELLREFEMGQGGSTRVSHVRQNDEGQVQLFLHNQTRLQYQ